MSLAPGSKFDRYVIASLLGQGGMGEVYRAHDTRLQRAVALKILRPGAKDGTPTGSGSSPSTDGAARLMREARAAAALDHPNAVAVFDVGSCEGVSFIAMEFIAGKTLRAYVGDGRVSLAQRVRWLLDAARALGAAHGRGLVHRDVKPENVMVRDDGVVKVLDFGIARKVSAPVDALASTAGMTFETLTGKGIVVGTPFYMAPEQMRGEPATPQTDVFAWGVVAYELLTGKLPWDASQGALQLVSQILSSDPPAPRSIEPAIAEELEKLILRALAKAPAARPATMEEVVSVLERHAAISTQIPSLPPGGAASGGAAVASTRTQLATSGASAPPRGRRAWIAAAIALAAAAAVAVAVFGHLGGVSDAGPTVSAPASTAAPQASRAEHEEAPSSANGEAFAAYRIAVQAARDAALDVAVQELDRAASLDDAFAAAHLRRAILPAWPDGAAREAYQRAVQLRANLGPRDRALLDAFEPWMRFVPDVQETQKRLAAAARERPADVDIALLLCRTRVLANDPRGAAEACEAARKIDPTLASAWYYEALADGVSGDATKTEAAYRECLARSTAASSCLADLIALRSNAGACDEAVDLARRLVAAYPRAAFGHLELARAIAGAGQPIDSVRLAIAQALDRVPAERRPMEEARARMATEAMTGDFAAAMAHLRELDRMVERSTDEEDHLQVALPWMEIALESEQRAEAVRVAKLYLGKRAAWTPAAHVDPSIEADRVRYAAGDLDAARFAPLRDAWLAKQRERPAQASLFGSGPADVWLRGFAAPALTEADAKVAFARLPDFALEPAVQRRDTAWAAQVGRAYLAAGRAADAVPLLRRAAGSCAAMRDPLHAVQASERLGAALEATGDTAGACEAYGRVIAAWSQAKPKSATATLAAARARALGCAP